MIITNVKNNHRKNAITAVMITLVLLLSACGKQRDSSTTEYVNNGKAQEVQYVYTPEYVELVGAEAATMSSSRIIGDYLYYTKTESEEDTSKETEEASSTEEDTSVETEEASSTEKDTSVETEKAPYTEEDTSVETKNPPSAEGDTSVETKNPSSVEEDLPAVRRFLCEYSLTDQRETRKMLLSEEGGYTYDIRVGQDGRVYVSDYSNSDSYGKLLVFDEQGEPQMQVDFKEWGARFAEMFAVDSQGRLYIVGTNETLALVNADGALYGVVELRDYFVHGIGEGKDGKVYINYSNSQAISDDPLLAEVSFEEKKISEKAYHNYLSSFSVNIKSGGDYDFLVNDGSGLYGYQLESESAEKLISWVDCGISVNPYGAFACAEDGTIRVLTRCGLGRESAEMAILTRTDASTLPEKTELVLGALYTSQDLERAVVAFNRQSDTCHITIKNYTDGGDVYIDTEEALQNINIDIISQDKCPDIFNLTDFNVEALAGNGVFEDLNPYFAQSTVVKKEDFLENVVDNYTYNGVLTAVPVTVTLTTLMGRSDIVGEKIGWTFEEMVEVLDNDPDIQPAIPAYNQSVLRTCLRFGYRDFIDWENDKAEFDCERFKNMLIFAGRYPSPSNGVEYYGSGIAQMREGELLYTLASISAFQDIQLMDYVYGGVTFIGYPTTDGSNGCCLYTNNACAIAAKSKHKEEAWEFIEFLLNSEMDEWSENGFPCNKDDLMSKITAVEYLRDSNGDIYLDSDGKPSLKYSHVIYEGQSYEYHDVTEEEAALVLSLLETAQFDASNDSVISRIIYDEAESFFQKQKTVDEVAALIQNRIQLYLDENW